jgi:hypothetical protein
MIAHRASGMTTSPPSNEAAVTMWATSISAVS